MKAITLLTMAFLPATFVATIFSMGFFDYSLNKRNEMELKVAPQVWMYVVVTVPLTLVVLGACAIWLKWNSKRLGGEAGDVD
jgi:Mg2+ and Co2+ transporter CorA